MRRVQLKKWAPPGGWIALADLIEVRGSDAYGTAWKRNPSSADLEAAAREWFDDQEYGFRVLNGPDWKRVFGDLTDGPLALASSGATLSQKMHQVALRERLQRDFDDRFAPLFNSIAADIRNQLATGSWEAAVQADDGLISIARSSFLGRAADAWLRSGERDGETIFVREAESSSVDEATQTDEPSPRRGVTGRPPNPVYKVAEDDLTSLLIVDAPEDVGTKPGAERWLKQWFSDQGHTEPAKSTVQTLAANALQRWERWKEQRQSPPTGN